MAADIQKTKYTEIETLMAKDTAAYPGEPILWMDLGHAQIGLNELEDAEKNYKKALDIANSVLPPQPLLIAAADAGLGDVYAYSLMVDEANAAFDAAAKADPTNAAIYLRNETVIFFRLNTYPRKWMRRMRQSRLILRMPFFTSSKPKDSPSTRRSIPTRTRSSCLLSVSPHFASILSSIPPVLMQRP